MTTVQPGIRDHKKKRIIIMILLAVLLMSVSMFLVQRDDAKTIIVTFPNGTEIEVEVADTPEKLLFGLAFQEALPSNGGMIYIFEVNRTPSCDDEGISIPCRHDLGRRKSPYRLFGGKYPTLQAGDVSLAQLIVGSRTLFDPDPSGFYTTAGTGGRRGIEIYTSHVSDGRQRYSFHYKKALRGRKNRGTRRFPHGSKG